MSITVKPFDNSEAKLYTLTNKTGASLTVSDLGAVVTGLLVPDITGKLTDIVLGYETSDGYKTNKINHGAIVGRCANRIKNAKAKLGDTTLFFDKNEGSNTHHGGYNKYYTRMWAAETGNDTVTFRLKSPDGDQGMPGNADIAVTYTLSDDNALHIDYFAVSDSDTIFNLTNHTYFNLDGHNAGAAAVANHTLWLDCDYFTVIDAEFIPTGEIRCVKGTPLDFTITKTLGADADSEYEQIKTGLGYDHNYVINRPSLFSPFATVQAAKSGIVMEAYSDLPGVQLYGGNMMGNDSGEKDGAAYVRRGAFCLETQYYPDAPNHDNFPSDIFKAGVPFKSSTIYKFSLR